ncbi:MAG: acyl-CoA carboxylase subunit beta [Lachnospiraceae bacterium]
MSNSKLSARERINQLLDDASFVEIGSKVKSRNTDFNLQDKETPADGVLTGYGTIEGNLVYVYSQDAAVLGGSIGEMHAKKIVKLYELAMKVGAPVIGLVDCAGLRLQESTDALHAFGDVFMQQTLASGVIPQLTGLFGVCGGGAAFIPTLTDFTVMVEDGAQLFVNSPNALAGNYAEKCDTSSAAYHAKETGMVDVVCADDVAALAQLRQFITILPANNEEDLSYDECTDDLNRAVAVAGCADDGKAVLTAISDNQFFLETKAEYAADMVTGFIRLNGVTVGCVANQVKVSEGMLTTAGADKAASFVTFCDAFAIPVLTLANAKACKATMEEEKTVAKAVSKLIYAYANATVPKVTVVTGETFGSAYVAMGSKSLGADMVFAWPDAKIGMMDAKLAAKVMYEDAAVAAKKAAEYDGLQNSVLSAAERGYVDDIIEPEATRKRMIAAMEMLFTKSEDRPSKKHGTI